MATLSHFDFDRLTWEKAILDILRSRPKHVWTLDEIYAEIESKPFIRPIHYELKYGVPNYKHWVRSHLAKMKQAGAVRHVGRARYAIAKLSS